jgi:hypothetical protein
MAAIGRYEGPLRVRTATAAERAKSISFIQEEVDMETLNSSSTRRVSWNKGRMTGQKPPVKLREIWAIRTRLQMSSNVRELALFNLAIDSELRACDLTGLQVQDICMGSQVVPRATFMQQKNAATGAVRNH